MNKSLDETINKMLKEIEEKNFEYFDREKAIQQLVLQHNEITRLNNIINELEKFLKINSEKDDYDLTEYNEGVNNAYNYTLDKLKELKEKKDE